MIQLKSGKALAIFCLNKVFHQKVKKEVKSRCIDNISKMLDSGNRFDRSEAAFQVKEDLENFPDVYVMFLSFT